MKLQLSQYLFEANKSRLEIEPSINLKTYLLLKLHKWKMNKICQKSLFKIPTC